MKEYKIYVQRIGSYTVIADEVVFGPSQTFFYKNSILISVCPTAITVIETIKNHVEPKVEPNPL